MSKPKPKRKLKNIKIPGQINLADIPRRLRSPREEPGLQSLSPSVAGQARNQEDNLKKAQTRVPDLYSATHQENSGG